MRIYEHGFDPGFWGWLLPLLVLVLVAAIVVLVLWTWRPRRPVISDSDPLRRAAARYAAGEIERVEFERIQRDLGAAVDDPIRVAALRLARGEITESEFDDLRDRLSTTIAAD